MRPARSDATGTRAGTLPQHGHDHIQGPINAPFALVEYR